VPAVSSDLGAGLSAGAAVRRSFGSERLREVLTLLLAGPAAVVRFPHGTWASTTDGRGRRGPAPPGLLEHRKPECAGRSLSGSGERVSILAASVEGEHAEAERRSPLWNSWSSS
jgi:hypothetical protein